MVRNFNYIDPYYVIKVRENGYDFEEHKISTEDGYILTAWRIPGKTGESDFSRIKRKPIILQHGLLESSYTWLMQNSTNSLAFILAENGFDVWMTNSRGNIFSLGHKNENYDCPAFYSPFWDFSFHEMALYDFPANILYVKKITNNEKVVYLGHSQGSIQYFINYTFNPKFIDKHIEKFVALGTVINVFSSTSQIVNFLHMTKAMIFLEKFYFKNILVTHKFVLSFITNFCKYVSFVCRPVIQFFVEDYPTNRIDYKYIFDNFHFTPGGTSARNINHWIQIFSRKKFSQFDFGEEENMKKYNRKDPPEYDLKIFKKYKVKTLLTSSNSDPFAKREDLDDLIKHMDMNNIQIKELDNYNHLDYLWSSDAKDDIYLDILKFLFN